MPLDAELQPVLDLIASGTPMSQQTPEEARRAFRTLTVDFRSRDVVVPVASVEDGVVAGAEGPLPARVYRPEGAGPVPTVVLFHGGGFVIGDLDTHDNMARAICRGTGAVVVSVEYRLAPEHPFPAAPRDAIAATKDVLANVASYGGGPKVAVAGDSAGGNLSAVVAQQVPGIAAQLLVYPAVDLVDDYASRTENGTGYLLDTPTMEWFMEQYLSSGAEADDPLLSPLRGDLAAVPPAVVVTAELDPLRDEGEAYAEALRAAGVEVTLRRYDGLIHGFFDLGSWSKASSAAIEETAGMLSGLLQD